MARLDEGQRAWLEGGLVGAAATVGARSATRVVRVFAQRASEDGAHVEFCIARVDAQRTLEDLEQHPVAALTLVCPRTYRSLQFKGPCAPVDAPGSAALLDACLERAEPALQQVGMPPGVAEEMFSHYRDRAVVTLRMRVEAVFDQSPGPRAGARL